jgi:Holliday junction resolvase
MSSYNKVKGSKFETDVMKYLRKLGHFAERLAKAGSSDEGDIVCMIAGETYILECKNRKKLNLPAFWDEARAEARNYAKARGISVNPLAFVIVKRKNKGIEDAWVIQNLDQWLEEKTMPTPQGEITSTEIIKPKEEKKEDK